ncbi:MAG: amidohydrolase [Pyrinomonadaceae bacterium]
MKHAKLRNTIAAAIKTSAITVSFLLLCASTSAGAAIQRQSSARGAATVDLLIVGGTIITMDAARRVIDDGAVAIRASRIVAIGPRAEIVSQFTAGQIINARGKVVIPGLINGHTHIPMTLFRGIADDLDLNEWLTKYIFPAEAKNVTEDFVRAGTRLGLAEMIRGGTTTYCDMYYFEDAIADETARAGVRGLLGETVIDFPAPDNKTHAEAMAFVEKFVKKWQGHPLITPAIAPHAVYTVSAEHLTAASAFATRTGAPIVIHVAESRKEIEDLSKSQGVTTVTYLDRMNFFNNRVVAAHVIHPSEDEIAILSRRKVGVAHNPQSNMKIAAGVAPVPQLIAAGVAVGLGTDGAASNNDLNMWEEMDEAAKLHKVTSGNPRAISAEQAFAMATIDGARALHMEREIGSLETGKRADVVIVGLDALHQTPLYNYYSHLVYATKAADVETVIVDGKILMRNRRLLTLNENTIKAEARQYRLKVSKSLLQK